MQQNQCAGYFENNKIAKNSQEIQGRRKGSVWKSGWDKWRFFQETHREELGDFSYKREGINVYWEIIGLEIQFIPRVSWYSSVSRPSPLLCTDLEEKNKLTYYQVVVSSSIENTRRFQSIIACLALLKLQGALCVFTHTVYNLFPHLISTSISS